MVAFQTVRLGLFLSHLAVHQLLICVVKCQGGMNLAQHNMPDTQGNLLRFQPGLVPADNRADGYTRAGDVRGAAFDAGGSGDQGSNVNVGCCCVHCFKVPVS